MAHSGDPEDGENLRYALARVTAMAETAAKLAGETSIALATHMIRCEGSTQMLVRDITDVVKSLKDSRADSDEWRQQNTHDSQELRKLILRIYKYGGIALFALAAVQLIGLENTFNLYKYLKP